MLTDGLDMTIVVYTFKQTNKLDKHVYTVLKSCTLSTTGRFFARQVFNAQNLK